MSLSLERMRYLVRKGLGGLDDTELTDTDCDELLNLALWNLESRYPFETKTTQFTTSLAEGQSDYDISNAALLSVLDSIISIAIVDDNGQRFKLKKMTRDWYDENYDNDSDAYGQPTRYLREGSVLIVHPTPDATIAGNSLVISAREGVASIVEGTKETTGLPREWDEIVVQGAIVNGHFFHEDYVLAREARNFQVGTIRTAVPTVVKEQSDNSRARLSVAWDEDDLR